MNLENVIINIILTGIAYIFYPLFEFKILKTENYTNEQIKKRCIINSIVVFTIIYIYRLIRFEDYKINPSPAILWFFINYSIFTRKKKPKKAKKKKKADEYIDMDNLSMDFIDKKKPKIKNLKEKKYKRLFIIFVILFSISIIINLFQYLNYTFINEEYEYELRNNNTLQEKVDFFNDNIAFVIDKNSNYYYNYDCLQSVMNGKEYSFWAYNKKQAINRGYKEYKCSSKIETLEEYNEKNKT